MKNKLLKPVMAVALAGIVALGSIVPFSATVDETQTASESGNKEAEVVYTQDSNFIVTIPKKITLDSDKTSAYEVNVIGDIASDEIITVVPDESFLMKDQAIVGTLKEDVTATVIQNKTEWTSFEIVVEDGSTTDGEVSAPDLTAGNWKGIFNFNINLIKQGFDITAVDELGTNLNATGSYIIGNQKNILINELVESGLIQNKNEVSTLINVQSDEFTGNAITTFDVSNIAQAGDIITFYHYDETDGWEYIGIAVVSEDGTATGSFNSFSPVAISVEKLENHVHSYNNGIITKEATCTEDGEKTFTCYCDASYTEVIPATGHSYGTVSYSWSSDNSTCTATRTCNECSNVESEEVNSTNVITKEATCTTAGVKTYTATFTNSAFEEQTTTGAISALGHNLIAGECSRCDYVEAGLYDANGTMLCSWEESGINVETSYGYYAYQTTTTSGYYVLKNKYPTATKIIIPEGVTSIGDYALYNCTSLISVTIPSSLTSTGYSALDRCTNLTSINVNENNENYCSVDGVLFNKDKTTLIQCPAGKTGSYTIPSSVTSIKYAAFGDCTSLTNITIPDSVTSIEDWAFNKCTGLTSVTIPDSVTSIGRQAFWNCTSLTSVTIGNSVTSIGSSAFYYCTSLTSIIIPSSVTSIGSGAFYNCTSLTSATFKTTSGWYIGSSAGAKTTALSSSSLSNTSTAATYLKTTYRNDYWTR